MNHTPFQAPEPEHLARLLPSLEIHAFIAQGGMGAVYKGCQRSLDRDVAVKVLPKELGADPMFSASFETEAKAMAKLNHPNLIPVYDFGNVEGMPYIVMEYVNGKSLFDSAFNKRIEARKAVRIAAGICRGLAHAHENGVIHRDIKPANILLTPKEEPKIGDFGLAHPADSMGPGLAMGTPGYLAPEILRDPGQASVRSDLYAVGVILRELLTGQRPDATDGQALAPTGNLRLDALWLKATHKDPARRYASAAEMADALEGWLRSAGPALAVKGPPSDKRPAAGPAARSKRPGPVSTRAKRRQEAKGDNVLLRHLVIIVVLLVAIGIAYKTYTRKKESIEAQRALAMANKPGNQHAAVPAVAVRELGEGLQPGTGVEGSAGTRPVAETPPVGIVRAKVEPKEEDRTVTPPPDSGESNGLVSSGVAAPPDDEEEIEGADEFGALRDRARQLIDQALRERDEKLAENTKSFIWDVEYSLRGLSHSDLAVWTPHVETFKGMVQNGRVPTPEDVTGQPSLRLSERMAKAGTFYHQKEREIDEAHQARMVQIRDAYVARLGKELAQAVEQGRRPLANLLREAERDAIDLEQWAESLAR